MKILKCSSDNEECLSYIYYQHQNNESFDVSVIIVNWNCGNYISRTIESLYAYSKDISFELIVLDNNSNKNDESYNFITQQLPSFENVKIILNNKNLGFAKANNIGIKLSSGKYILLLNPDTKLKSNVLKTLSEYLNKNPKTGIIGPKVLKPDGDFQSSCMRGEPYPIDVFFTLSGISRAFENKFRFNKFALNHKNKNKTQTVAGLSGCCMMIRQEVLRTIGLLDEQFFLYFEETDLCWRTYNQKWNIVYNPNALIVHQEGISTSKKFFVTNLHFIVSMTKFLKKHYLKRYNLILQALIIFFVFLNLPVRNLRSIIRSCST